MLTRSVSVRLPRDHAALARMLEDRSSKAARMALAVSATNIKSSNEDKTMRQVILFRIGFIKQDIDRSLIN